VLTEKPRFPVREMLLHGWLPSPIKRFFYRLKGYRIGRGVSLAFGSVICADQVEVGEHTRLGFFSVIRAKTVRLGSYVQIGSATMIDTPHVEVGDGTKINEQVFIGGLQFPDSRLVVGRNCQIMQMTFINPARSIVIGDDTGIGGYCLIFGHTSWLSKFEGYPVEFDSIEIGRSVSLAWRVFVLPGTKIGDGAVIGANSLVNQAIPPRCLAVGFPARVVARAPYFPRQVTDAEKEVFLKDIMAEMMAFFEGCGFHCRMEGAVHEVIDPRRRWWRPRPRRWRMAVEYGRVTHDTLRCLPKQLDVFVSLRSIPPEVRAALEARGQMWIDLEAKERPNAGNPMGEEVVQYLRRYGVRFFRVGSQAVVRVCEGASTAPTLAAPTP
jgi:acetyltransferase-like isoleucine patch superfamily enzyme